MPAIDIGQVASDAAAAMLGVLKTHAADIAAYARAEAEKIAVATAQIAQLRADGIIDDAEMMLHLDIQRNASRAVLMAVKGIGISTAEQAVNAALAVVRLAIEDAIGIAIP